MRNNNNNTIQNYNNSVPISYDSTGLPAGTAYVTGAKKFLKVFREGVRTGNCGVDERPEAGVFGLECFHRNGVCGKRKW